MSILLMSQVFELDVDHPVQSVLMALADNADDDGRSLYPSVDYLAWKTGYGDRHVRRIMRELRKREALKIVKAASWHNPTEYILVLAVLPRKKLWADVRADKMSRLAKSAPTNSRGSKPTPDILSGVLKSPVDNPSDLTPESVRPDIAVSVRPDIAMSAYPSLTIKEPSGRARARRPGPILKNGLGEEGTRNPETIPEPIGEILDGLRARVANGGRR